MKQSPTDYLPLPPEGGWFKSSMDHSVECGPVAGEVQVHLLGTAEVPLGKTLNPYLLGVTNYVAAMSL